MNRRAIVAANWKMNGDTKLVSSMVESLSGYVPPAHTSVVICPSYPYLALMSDKISQQGLNENIALGAQNANEHLSGAFTGEVSTNMLTEMSVKYVIVGHSERRSIYQESSEKVAEKVKVILDAGLTPILCIGESEQERIEEKTEVVLTQQLQPVVDAIGVERFKDVVVAYEPVWAIGTGKTASPEMAQATHAFIRGYFANLNEEVANKVPLLYGGSVNASNCDELFAQADIDGGLIGGASLKVDEFKVICSAAKGS
ncbi:triose-phosphate isomerase [Thalassotalea sp. PLHSN55]|uniref:triose-phosphate isomerase n=1 Tax=Thalassotalea sp. PLHSN55 TaxID=3435888 RepID=UPI003F826839